MNTLIDSHKEELAKAVKHLEEDLATLRVGRANPMLVEEILVEAYGVKTPIKQLASISVPSARSLVIQPWDKGVLKDIEKGIIEANIGIAPVNEGDSVRLNVPQLTEESRKELVKSVGEKMEKARISIRQIRDRIKEGIVKQEKDNELTEDDRFNSLKKLEEIVKEYNEKIKVIGEKKEEEIMTI